MADPLDNIFQGLRELCEESFPKTCTNCGRRYETREQFIKETLPIPATSGLKESKDFDRSIIVELFRNCTCGSTLMETFSNRRDESDAGKRRRQRFNEIMHMLEQQGVAKTTAHSELLRVIHGQDSQLIRRMVTRPK